MYCKGVGIRSRSSAETEKWGRSGERPHCIQHGDHRNSHVGEDRKPHGRQAQGGQLRACYEASKCLSADVTNAFDPMFAEVHDQRNNARANYGAAICKYTGARGKSGASDASAELMGWLRRVLEDRGVIWQTAELGKVDQGGGGTVAVYMAKRNIDTVDIGVPVLSMHAPFEVVTKLDLYMTMRAMEAFYQAE